MSRAGRLVLGALLATLVAWSPGAVQPVLAAGPLQVRADTRYTVDPGAGRVHVAIEYTITNNKPNTATVIYYYRDLTFGIQDDVRQVRATDGSGGLGVTTRNRDGFTQVEVRLRANLYYRRSTTFTLRYDLVGGAPRSQSPLRVGAAFATFGVWAFGDPGRGSVEVRLPSGFTSTVDGDEMQQSGGVGSGIVLRASPAEPDAFFAIVTADSPGRYEKQRLSLPGGIELVISAWPEDPEWADSVATTMEEGIPRLQELIGLDWGKFRDLNVQERYTPALEGYAGIYRTDLHRIDMSEDLDPVTTLHEASHVWFNHNFFDARWITEGLAEDYSFRVYEEIGGEPVDRPGEPDPADPGFVRLNGWVFPTIVRDDVDETESYGYRTSAWLMHAIVEETGLEGMREAFRRADVSVTAYQGAGEPERVGIRDDWRRFLDLTQPIDEEDPAAILEAFAGLVVRPSDEAAMAQRREAREAYRALLEAGDGWLPPWYVRAPMGEWQFDDATARITEATAVLALRDQVDAAAASAGLTVDDTLRAAYEGAQDGFDGAEELASDQLAAITAITTARDRVDASPDFVAQLGLIGETPRVPYEAARAAFQSGDLGSASSLAAAAAAIMDRAAGLGQERLLLGVAVAAGLLLLLGVALMLLWRRRRRAVAARSSAASLVALDARFAPTLGADPEAQSAPLAAPPPDADGGPP